jgi:hypothetical protein
VRKIRDFRLRLSLKETRRRCRKAADLAALGVEDDRSFQALLDRFEAAARPAVIFETFGGDTDKTVGLAPIPGLANTLGLSTLGPGVEPLLAQARAEGEARGRLLEALAAIAVDETVRFVIDLLQEDLETERCELSPIHFVVEPEPLRRVLETLQGEKIGLALTEAGALPPHSAAFCLSWLAQRGRAKAGKVPAKKK